jgi:hypothetical protein
MHVAAQRTGTKDDQDQTRGVADLPVSLTNLDHANPRCILGRPFRPECIKRRHEHERKHNLVQPGCAYAPGISATLTVLGSLVWEG